MAAIRDKVVHATHQASEHRLLILTLSLIRSFLRSRDTFAGGSLAWMFLANLAPLDETNTMRKSGLAPKCVTTKMN